MFTKKRIIVAGGSGLFSTNAVRILKESSEVFCLSRNPRLKVPGVKYYSIDLADILETNRLLEKFQPDVIINAAGLTSVEQCENDYYKGYTSNVLVAKSLSNFSAKNGAKLIHISTDHFSDSKVFMAKEDQIEIPRNNYAATKLEADRIVLKNDVDAIVARTNFYGWGHRGRPSFSDFIISNLRSGNEISLFDDVIYSPILIDQLLSDISKLNDGEKCGVFNICSRRPITKQYFGKLVAEEFSLDPSLIRSCQLSSRKDLVARPLDMSLSNEKFLLETNLPDYPSIKQMLKTLRETESDAKSVFDRFNENRKIFNYGKQQINDLDIDRVVNVVCNKNLTQGDEVTIFEEEIKKITGAKYAVAVSNWTSGLHLSCLALGIGPGDKVVTTPNTFVASANCIKYTGGEVILCDIDKETLNICPNALEKICLDNPGIKAVIPVHFAGAPCEMEKIKSLSKKYKFSLIEDAAHALGGKYWNGNPIGSCEFSDIVGFSFHPVKNIACGEGGCILTNNEAIYKTLLRLRSHGISKGNEEIVNTENAIEDGHINPWYYEMLELGYNYRITDIQSALGTSQIQRLSFFMEKRRTLANIYDKLFSRVDRVRVPQVKTRNLSGNHLYMVLVPFESLGISKNLFYRKMKENGVNCHLHYIPIHFQPYYNNLRSSLLPNSERIYFESVTLPLHVGLSEEDIHYIFNTFVECLSK